MKLPAFCLLALCGLSLLAALPAAPAAGQTDEQALAAALAAQQQRVAAIARATAACVCVFCNDGNGGGSGVVITPDGYALTNYHVVQPAGNFMKCSLPDGNLYDAVLVSIDPTGDVAMIKLLGREDFPCAELGDSETVRAGDWCFAIGNPFLLATNFEPSVSFGIVSGVHRYQFPAGTLLEYTDCIQTDAAINPGNSGGPLFNAQGQLIGINGRGSFEKRGRVNVGVGYAISINQIKNFMGYLRSGRIVDHATLGATAAPAENGAVTVTNLLESSDAYRRGLRYDDEIVAFGGRPITTANAFKNVLGIFPKGWRVPLSFRREGQRYDVLVRLAGVHSEEELLQKIQGAEAKPEAQPGPPKVIPQHVPAAGPPEEWKKFFKEKRGYANYYFNELNRDRVWAASSKDSNLQGRLGAWRFKGEAEGGGAIELTLAENEVSGVFPTGPASLDLGKDLDAQLGPTGSGGLLAALHVWRRLLTQGPLKFGAVYYQGTAPIPTQPALADVLVGVFGVLETRFLFDPASGRLAGVEMYPDTNVDPCEVYFSDYRQVDGTWLPHRLEVRFGNETFGVFNLKSITLDKQAPREA